MKKTYTLLGATLMLFAACNSDMAEPTESTDAFTGAPGEVKIMTLDPGHFHAALVQKYMYEQVDSTVYIYAPPGDDLQLHLDRIEGFNTRAEEPTFWETEIYEGKDFLEKMLTEKPGNVVVISGNNADKAAYIKESVEAGLNVLADKPMVIKPADFEVLQEAFALADSNEVLLYDIMTERYEITTILQKRLSQFPDLFGEQEKGSLDNPAITKESVHHFFKYVAGSPLQRPPWFFDVEQQGEGVVDVSTHLVDLVFWETFPEQVIDYENDLEVLTARRWATELTPSQFERVTKLDTYPDYLQKDVKDSVLHVYSNGEINFTVKGVHAKVSVIWNYEAPEGAKDTHYSILRGTKANLVIRQGAAQNYLTTLYVEPTEGVEMAAAESALEAALADLSSDYPGLAMEKSENGWIVNIPDKFKVGHEAHFAQVTERYLQYLKDGKLPDWEIPNILAKYYVTTKGYELSR